MIYLACFALSAFLAYLAGKQQKKWLFFLISAVSIALPVLLAALRGMNVGIDNLGYYEAKRFWATASTVDQIADYFAYYTPKGYGEWLFAILTAVIGQTKNYILFLFIIHSFIMVCVYIGAFRLRDQVRPWLVLLLFFLLYYNHSLNIMRQYMAMAFVFAFTKDLLQKKYLRFCLMVLIASQLHTSALLCLALVLIHWVLTGDFTKLRGFDPSVRARKLFIFACVAVGVVLLYPVARVLLNTRILHSKYNFYLTAPFTSYNLLVTLFLVVEMIPIFLLCKELQKKFEHFHFFSATSVVLLLLYQVTAVFIYGKRIAMCCSFVNLITLAMLPEGLGEGITLTLPQKLGGKQIVLFGFLAKLSEKHRKLLGTALVIVAVGFYWWYVYVLRNSSETMPYTFIFQ